MSRITQQAMAAAVLAGDVEQVRQYLQEGASCVIPTPYTSLDTPPEQIRIQAVQNKEQVLRTTIFYDTKRKFVAYKAAILQAAQINLAKWQQQAAMQSPHNQGRVQVVEGDWAEVTQRYTAQTGKVFAVLNMANAHLPGGRYLEGTAAQEENMFRRTDCSFYVDESSLLRHRHQDRVYPPELTRLLNAEDGRVYLDTENARFCIKGKEVVSNEGVGGYQDLASDEIFGFYELRSAAQDCRRGVRFDEASARKRIAAQLDTCIEKGIRDVVLGAFGCGAFNNPPATIARLYREELDKRAGAFDNIVFAIYYAGYGPRENYQVFKEALDDSYDLVQIAAREEVNLKFHTEWAAQKFRQDYGMEPDGQDLVLRLSKTEYLALQTGHAELKLPNIQLIPELSQDPVLFCEWLANQDAYQKLMARIEIIDKRKDRIGQDTNKNLAKKAALEAIRNAVSDKKSPGEIRSLIEGNRENICRSTSSKCGMFRGAVDSEPLFNKLVDEMDRIGVPPASPRTTPIPRT